MMLVHPGDSLLSLIYDPMYLLLQHYCFRDAWHLTVKSDNNWLSISELPRPEALWHSGIRMDTEYR